MVCAHPRSRMGGFHAFWCEIYEELLSRIWTDLCCVNYNFWGLSLLLLFWVLEFYCSKFLFFLSHYFSLMAVWLTIHPENCISEESRIILYSFICSSWVGSHFFSSVVCTLQELPDIPLFLSLHNLCATLKCTSPSAVIFRSAVINAGYRISGTHVNPLGLKTDAPMDVIWDIMRSWVWWCSFFSLLIKNYYILLTRGYLLILWAGNWMLQICL